MSDQIAAAIECFFWPKILWDFLTRSLDPAIKPIPILQIINVLMGLGVLAWEWPLGSIAGSFMHRSIEMRLVLLPLTALLAVMLYQGTNAALYYLIGMVVYFWAFSEGEVSKTSPKIWKTETASIEKLTGDIDHLCQALDIATARTTRCSVRGSTVQPPQPLNNSRLFAHLSFHHSDPIYSTIYTLPMPLFYGTDGDMAEVSLCGLEEEDETLNHLILDPKELQVAPQVASWPFSCLS